ncbi:MAG: hypothetical protein AAGJ35_12595, partial [Myxococcota bacterium]
MSNQSYAPFNEHPQANGAAAQEPHLDLSALSPEQQQIYEHSYQQALQAQQLYAQAQEAYLQAQRSGNEQLAQHSYQQAVQAQQMYTQAHQTYVSIMESLQHSTPLTQASPRSTPPETNPTAGQPQFQQAPPTAPIPTQAPATAPIPTEDLPNALSSTPAPPHHSFHSSQQQAPPTHPNAFIQSAPPTPPQPPPRQVFTQQQSLNQQQADQMMLQADLETANYIHAPSANITSPPHTPAAPQFFPSEVPVPQPAQSQPSFAEELSAFDDLQLSSHKKSSKLFWVTLMLFSLGGTATLFWMFHQPLPEPEPPPKRKTL